MNSKQPVLYSKFQASLDYRVRFCFKSKQTNNGFWGHRLLDSVESVVIY